MYSGALILCFSEETDVQKSDVEEHGIEECDVDDCDIEEHNGDTAATNPSTGEFI